MAEHHWLKFWPQDWQRDFALHQCSPAARCLWLECLCVMHDAEPYGHLVLFGKPATTKDISAFSNIPSNQIQRLLAELEARQVFSRRRDGVIFSRRMVRDKIASDMGRQNGRNGGNPNLRGGGDDDRGKPPPLSRGVNPPSYRGGQSLEAEAESEAAAEADRRAADFSCRRDEALAPLAEGWETDEQGDRRPVYGEWYLDSLADEVEAAAKFRPDWARDWHMLAGWLREGISPEQIIGGVGSLSHQASYKPRWALQSYDKLVRKFRVKP